MNKIFQTLLYTFIVCPFIITCASIMLLWDIITFNTKDIKLWAFTKDMVFLIFIMPFRVYKYDLVTELKKYSGI